MHDYHLVVEHQPDPAELAYLEERLANDAIAAVGAGGGEEFGIYVRGRDCDIAAGVSASAWGGCCEVHAIWVDSELRGQGWGRTLMESTEAEARRRGCRLIMGLTYDVLTADFYDRQGYCIVGMIEDCPVGTTTRWYRKDL